MGTLKPQSNGPLYRNTVIGTQMGGLLHFVQGGGAWAGCGPPINGHCTNFILFDVAYNCLCTLKG